MQERIDLLRSYAALIRVLEEHARALSLTVVDLRAEGNDAAADALTKLEQGHHARIRRLRSEADTLMTGNEPPDSGA